MGNWLSLLCGLSEISPAEGAISDPEGAGLLLRMDGQEYVFDGAPGGAVELCDDRGMSVFSDINGDGIIDSVSTVLFDGDCYTVECEPGPAPVERWGLDPEDGLGVTERGDTSWGLVEQITPEGVTTSWWGLDGKVQET